MLWNKKDSDKENNYCNESYLRIENASTNHNINFQIRSSAVKERSKNNKYILLLFYVLSGLITGLMCAPGVAAIVVRRFRSMNLSYEIEYTAVVVGCVLFSFFMWLRFRTRFERNDNYLPCILAIFALPINIILLVGIIIDPSSIMVNAIKWLALGLITIVVLCLFRIVYFDDSGYFDDK